MCESDVPWLDYDVDLDVQGETTVTMTWVDPDGLGRDLTLTDLPSSGRLLWPGAELDADERPVDWPGWARQGDLWVEDDSDAWLRGPLMVHVAIESGDGDVEVSYPAATEACVASPEGDIAPGAGSNASPSAGTGNAAATPPTTATVDPSSDRASGGPAVILALLATLFAASLAAADRAERPRRR